MGLFVKKIWVYMNIMLKMMKIKNKKIEGDE